MARPDDWRLSRLGAAVMGGCGLLLWTYGWVARPSRDILFLAALMLGPMVALLGIGGAIEPRVLRSLRPEGKGLPARYQVIAGVLALGGLAVSAYRIARVYPLLGMR
jgi:hypothetical protein